MYLLTLAENYDKIENMKMTKRYEGMYVQRPLVPLFSLAGWVVAGGPGSTVAALSSPASITATSVPAWARLTCT